MIKRVYIGLLLCFSVCATLVAFSLSDYNAIELEKSKIYVSDGDTIVYGTTTFRVLGIDAPEIAHEKYGKVEDQYLGEEAKAFAQKKVAQAKHVYVIPANTADRYERPLAHIVVDDQLLATQLIKAGLAYETVSRFGDNGFPKLAEEIYNASQETAKPNCENPFFWRKKHWKQTAQTKTNVTAATKNTVKRPIKPEK